MDFQEAHEMFLEYGQAKGYSPGTIVAYRQNGKNFMKFLAEKGYGSELGSIDAKVIRRYTVWISNAGNARETIRRKLNFLGSFFRFCEVEELVTQNPMVKVDRPKKAVTVPIFLTSPEVDRLFHAVDSSYTSTRLRDSVLVRLMLYDGLRNSEVRNLNWENIDFETGMITVLKAKGQKDRVVPMNSDLKKHFWNYLESSLPLRQSAVFLNKYRNRLQPHNLTRLLKNYAKKAGIDKRVVPHLMRHTCRTLLAQHTDLITVQNLLGHESVSTTQRYSHTTKERMAEAVDKIKLT